MKAHFTMLLAVALAAPLFAEEPMTASAEAAPPKPALVTLDGLSVGTGVQDRVLQGAATTFFATAGRVFCHNKVMTSDAPTTIRHVWSKDGETRGDITLNVGGNGWRNWSNHAVEPGSWKVDVLDAGGALVESVSFTVTE